MAKFRKPFDPTVLDTPTRDDGGPVNTMTLRDWLAGKALSGYSARNLKADTEGDWPSYADIARWAYEQADAMITARAKAEGR